MWVILDQCNGSKTFIYFYFFLQFFVSMVTASGKVNGRFKRAGRAEEYKMARVAIVPPAPLSSSAGVASAGTVSARKWSLFSVSAGHRLFCANRWQDVPKKDGSAATPAQKAGRMRDCAG